MFTLQLLVK